MFDAKILDILKATSWQNIALAFAATGFLLLHKYGLIYTDPWMVTLAVAVLLVTACLAIAASISTAISIFPVHHWIARRRRIRAAQKAVETYIPYMTGEERQIIAYLLSKNQKMFTADSDGGYARTLLGRGIVAHAVLPNVHYEIDDIPMQIPDHVWEVLKANEAKFPYKPDLNSGVEVHPWRIPWQLK